MITALPALVCLPYLDDSVLFFSGLPLRLDKEQCDHHNAVFPFLKANYNIFVCVNLLKKEILLVFRFT